MASSNRHWPSMFKSKPCNVHHQWHHDINASLMSVPCHRPSCNTGPSGEERNPEPKPRWNPKPEQIRILESIFNSGLVNPPRDEIKKIRTQLQEYGQVGDANVFYWFQNRKSRSKNKQRQLQSSKAPPSSTSANAVAAMSTPTTTATSSSSSSSDKSSPGIDKSMAISVPKSNPFIPDPSIPTTYVNYLNFNSDYSKDPLLFPVQQHSGSGLSEWFQFSEQGLLNELINHGGLKRMDEELKMKDNCVSTFHPFPSATAFVAAATTNSTTATTTAAAVNEIQGIGDIPMGLESSIVTARLTVFINDVAFEIPSGPLNVREFFGDETVLLHSSGQPVVIDEWGVTLNSLQHGNSYYLVRL